MKWGFVMVTLYMGPPRPAALRDGRQGAATRDPRGLRRAALEAERRLDDSLLRRRRDRDHRRGGDHCDARSADVVDYIVEYVVGFSFSLFISRRFSCADDGQDVPGK